MTNAQITRAIFKATEIDGVKVGKAEGLCYFYRDIKDDYSELFDCDVSVCVFKLKDLSLDQWVAEFVRTITAEQ